MGSLHKRLLPRGGGVVSLVGAGGKTTLMYRLAREIAEAGETVLTTTTTKIRKPAKEQSASLVVSAGLEDVISRSKECLADHPHVTAAREDLASDGKLDGFDPSVIDAIRKTGLFRWILVEADGAAGRPLKAPADHEPVVPTCSCLVIGVVGMEGVGKPLGERHVFRPELFSHIADLPLGSAITEESIARSIEHEEGLFKGSPSEARRMVLLNQVEGDGTRKAAERVASFLIQGEAGFDRICVGAVGNEPTRISCCSPFRRNDGGSG